MSSAAKCFGAFGDGLPSGINIFALVSTGISLAFSPISAATSGAPMHPGRRRQFSSAITSSWVRKFFLNMKENLPKSSSWSTKALWGFCWKTFTTLFKYALTYWGEASRQPPRWGDIFARLRLCDFSKITLRMIFNLYVDQERLPQRKTYSLPINQIATESDLTSHINNRVKRIQARCVIIA